MQLVCLNCSDAYRYGRHDALSGMVERFIASRMKPRSSQPLFEVQIPAYCAAKEHLVLFGLSLTRMRDL